MEEEHKLAEQQKEEEEVGSGVALEGVERRRNGVGGGEEVVVNRSWRWELLPGQVVEGN